MKKEYLLMFFMAVVLIFGIGAEGCEKKEEGTVSGERFIGSKEGITLAFAASKPYPEFNIDDSVPVEVVLKNNGEYDIPSGDAKVKLFGLNLDQFNLPAGYKGASGILRGISQLNEDPGEQRISFGDMKFKGTLLSPQFTYNLKAKVCYPYQTLIETKVCIGSKEIELQTEDSVCDIEGEKIKSGDVSSAPVQVTSVTEKLFGKDRIKLMLVVKNVGTGKVYDPQKDCDKLSDIRDMDIVHVQVAPMDIQCEFGTGEPTHKGEVTLTEGSKTLTCWRTVALNEENYEDKLDIKLTYKYTDETETGFTVFA